MARASARASRRRKYIDCGDESARKSTPAGASPAPGASSARQDQTRPKFVHRPRIPPNFPKYEFP